MSRVSLKRKNNEEDDLIEEENDDEYEYNSIVATVKNHDKTRRKPVSSIQYFRPVSSSLSSLSSSSVVSRVPIGNLSLSHDNISSPEPILNGSDVSFDCKMLGRARHKSEPMFVHDEEGCIKFGQPTSTSRELFYPCEENEYESCMMLSSKKKRPKMRESWIKFRSFSSYYFQDISGRDAPLPELNWVDKQEMWELMVKKETGIYERQKPNTILSRHPAIEPRMRAILIDWLSEVCEVYKMHRETFYLAVDFLDRFLGVAEYVSRDKLQLVGVTCLFIGSKIEEIYPPPVKEFAYVTDGACTIEDIKLMELDIVKKLNWGLAPMTPNSWLKVFMQICHGPKTVSDSCTLPSYSGFEFSMAMQIIDLCMLDIGSLEFRYSILATAALCYIESEAVAIRASGYPWEVVAPCVRWMSAFVHALHERCPQQIKFSHGIQPDDSVHNLQTHAVDLDHLVKAQEKLLALANEVTPTKMEGDIISPFKENHRKIPSIIPVESSFSLLSPPLDS